MNKIRLILIAVLFARLADGKAQVRLPGLISDGAVFQRGTELKLWGWASPDEKVDLLFDRQYYRTLANAHGRWQLSIPSHAAGGPYEMVFTGRNRIILRDIYFGDVWLCSGQSNMELTMERVRDTYPGVIEHSENPHIRQFVVPDRYDFNKEHDDLETGSWEGASPETLKAFSAVAYFFATEIYQRYKIPIGLINAALGGSPVEAWMSEDALRQFPDAYWELQQFRNEDFVRKIQESDQARQRSWYDELGKKDQGLARGSEWYFEGIADDDWEEMDVPGYWADQGGGAIHGVVWFRKKINIPASMTGKEARLWLGRIIDQDHVYVNGKFVGTTGYQYPPRKYTVAGDLLREGENTLVVRVINEQGKGGFVPDKPYFLAAQNDTIDLKGNWKYKTGTEMPRLESQTFIRWKAGGLYKGMIAPLLDYRIKGVIWYQGESNTANPAAYNETFPALIRNWRDKWNSGDFPFIYVQLANFMEETDQPSESNWAELRQAQLNTLSVPNTGMAVTIDLGEWNDIHPLNKKDVGKRLALLACKLAYGERETDVSSPIPHRYRFCRKKVRIRFKNTGGRLVTKNGNRLEYFEISDDGKHFVQATAVIKRNRVTVRHDEVDHPAAVRYGWADNPKKANLYSVTGLPASPFEIMKESTSH